MATDPIFNNQGYAEAIKKEVLKRDKTILASTFSVDGDYLICGSNKGYIAVWYLPKYFVSTILLPQLQVQPSHFEKYK
jgi:WD40 repeat protein